MKTKKMRKPLVFDKETVVNLDNERLEGVNGGASISCIPKTCLCIDTEQSDCTDLC